MSSFFELKDKKNSLIFSGNGNLVSASFDGHETITREHPLCRIILGRPDYAEFQADPIGLPERKQDTDFISFTWNKFLSEDGIEYDFICTITARLENGIVRWGIELIHKAPENVSVREVHYPVFAMKNPERMGIMTGNYLSAEFASLTKYIDDAFTAYMASDQKIIRRTCSYPGFSFKQSLNFHLYPHNGTYFYLGCHDEKHLLTAHSAEREIKSGTVNLFLIRYPFLKKGNVFKENCCVCADLPDWTDGCFLYRSWAEKTWYKPPCPPPQIAHIAGWQRLILHHQFGEYYFHYNELERLYDEGKAAGLDTLFLFGWWLEGMDAGYPDYTPDPVQGGTEELRKNILKVRQKGGHVMLYFNGQLIDMTSKYYRSGAGQRICVKRENGVPAHEAYNFSNTGTFLLSFGNKDFVRACPGCAEWTNLLKQKIDFAAYVGADTVFFDQFGLGTVPCFDKTHGHNIPFTDMMEHKAKVMSELREYIHTKYPGMGFMTECVTDNIAAQADAMHLVGYVTECENPGWQDRDEEPQFFGERNLFRMTFPEIIISNRSFRDGNELALRANTMILMGLRLDAEIFRCRAGIAAFPEAQKYIGKVMALRNEFADVLYDGLYRGPLFHTKDNPRVHTCSYESGDKLAIVATQYSKSEQSAKIAVPGYDFIRCASVDDKAIWKDGTLTLPVDALAVLLFQKSEK